MVVSGRLVMGLVALVLRLRVLAIVSLPLIVTCAGIQPANALLERIGQESIDRAFDRLQTMQDRLVQDLFDNGNKLIDKLVKEASNERKSAVIQIGSEFQYAVTNLTAQFGSEARGTISNASAEFRKNLAVILAWIDSIQELANSVSALEDDFAIDIQSLPFVTKHFSIRRVSGVNILQGERSMYPIRITGERFGRPESGEEITVKASIGDKELVRGATLGPNQLEFEVPATFLADHFKSKEVNTLDLNISAARDKKNCWFSCKEEARGTFKLILLPEKIGELEVQIKRPKYAWQPRETITRQFAIKSSNIIPLDPLSILDGKRRRYGTPSVTCVNIKRDAWKLPNGKILLPEDKLLSDGWSSSSYVGQPPGPDLSRFDTEAVNALGFTMGFYANNSCPFSKHCNISSDEIRRRSMKLTELGYCDIMKVAAIDLSPDQERGSVTFVGSAPHESLFEIKAPIEVFEQVGFESDPNNQTKDVSSTRYVDVEVPADTLVSLVFRAFDGITRDGRIPEGLPRGLKVVHFKNVGQGMTVYSLQFARGQ
jgi:hypothetical protein